MKEDKNVAIKTHAILIGTEKDNQGTNPERKESSKDSNTYEMDEGKHKKELKFESRSAYTQETDENGVFPSLLCFAPELQMLHWEYNMDTVIDNHIDGIRFTVHKYMEGKVDSDSIPIKKKEEDARC